MQANVCVIIPVSRDAGRTDGHLGLLDRLRKQLVQLLLPLRLPLLLVLSRPQAHALSAPPHATGITILYCSGAACAMQKGQLLRSFGAEF